MVAEGEVNRGDDFRAVIEGVHDLLREGHPDRAIDLLLASDIVVNRERDAEISAKHQRQCLSLLKLRCQIEEDAGRLTTAREVLLEVIQLSLVWEDNCDGSLPHCLLPSVVALRIYESKILRRMSRYGEALECLVAALRAFRSGHTLIERQYDLLVRGIDDLGDLLGHPHLASLMVAPHEPGELHWTRGVRLGQVAPESQSWTDLQYVQDLARIVNRGIAQYSQGPSSRLRNFEEQIELLEAWSASAPWAPELKEATLSLRFEMTKSLLGVGDFERLIFVWGEIRDEATQLGAPFGENWDRHRELARNFYTFALVARDAARAAVDSDAQESALAQAMVESIALAHLQLREARRFVGVSQPFALLNAEVYDFVSRLEEAAGDFEHAQMDRARRAYVIERVLQDDPNNPRALELRERLPFEDGSWNVELGAEFEDWTWANVRLWS